jgi:ABC-type transporter Mla MlaB component
MVLEICICDNCFRLKGNLTKKHLYIFQKAFKDIFNKVDDLILNIEELNAIDRDGVSAITKLHNLALTENKKLTIIGLGNKELYDHFRTSDAA